MSNLSVIERYSSSLFQVAEKEDILLKIKEELNQVAKIFKKDEKIKSFFTSPAIRKNEKISLLKEILEYSDFSNYTINYFNLLIQNNRFDFDVPYLSYISFNNFYLKSQGIKKGKIVLVKELNDEEKEKLIIKISTELGFKVDLDFHYDPDLIDGIYLEIEGTLYEDNIKKRLSELKKWLKG